MATSTIVNYLEGGSGLGCSNRRQIETFKASEALSVGNFVSVDFSKAVVDNIPLYVLKASTGANRKCCVGVTLDAVTLAEAAAGKTVRVVVSGPVEGICLGHAADDPLAISATAGSADTSAAAAPVVAFSVDGTTGLGTVFMLKQAF